MLAKTWFYDLSARGSARRCLAAAWPVPGSGQRPTRGCTGTSPAGRPRRDAAPRLAEVADCLLECAEVPSRLTVHVAVVLASMCHDDPPRYYVREIVGEGVSGSAAVTVAMRALLPHADFSPARVVRLLEDDPTTLPSCGPSWSSPCGSRRRSRARRRGGSTGCSTWRWCMPRTCGGRASRAAPRGGGGVAGTVGCRGPAAARARRATCCACGPPDATPTPARLPPPAPPPAAPPRPAADARRKDPSQHGRFGVRGQPGSSEDDEVRGHHAHARTTVDGDRRGGRDRGRPDDRGARDERPHDGRPGRRGR